MYHDLMKYPSTNIQLDIFKGSLKLLKLRNRTSDKFEKPDKEEKKEKYY